MNAEETLKLYALGRDAWNKWASDITWSKNNTLNWENMASADFSYGIYEDELNFSDFIFPHDVDFSNCDFKDKVKFKNTSFGGEADFSTSTFFYNCNFEKAIFCKEVTFSNSNFKFDVWFSGAKFKDKADFMFSKFNCLASFDNCKFSSTVNFNQSKLHDASFIDTKFEGGLFLIGVIFEKLLYLYSAQFKEAPHFDGITILNSNKEKGAEATSRWRSLRQLAAKSNDHEAELNFFAGELKSRQEPVMRWFARAYELFSDFGRAIFRPLGWLVFTAFLTFNFYLAKHSPLVFEKGIAFTHLKCIQGDPRNGPRTAALLLSLEKALPLISGKDEKAKQNLLCLYGGTSETPYIPDSVSAIGTIQTLISLIFLFLAGLGLRNRFRLK